MKYADFEKIMSSQRMERYLTACGANTRKAMTLYRYNLQISQEMFTIVSCFEVALRMPSFDIAAEWRDILSRLINIVPKVDADGEIISEDVPFS